MRAKRESGEQDDACNGHRAGGRKGGVGRGLYKPEFAQQAERLCLLGLTDEELGRFFEVSAQSIKVWLGKFEDFRDACRRGKDEADANVAERLYRRAMGYEHPAEKIFLHEGKVVRVPYTERFPPEVAAGIFWLKNRKPEMWRDRREFTGADGKPLVPEPQDQLEVARRVAFLLNSANQEAIPKGRVA